MNGFAYVITSVDQVDTLRVYEGDNYEVVAARMIVVGKEIMGRAFRFAGFAMSWLSRNEFTLGLTFTINSPHST